MQRHGILRGALDIFQDFAIGEINGVGLGRGAEVDDGLRQRQVAFGYAEEIERIAGGQRDAERVRIGEPNVFDRHSDHASRNVKPVLARLQHTSQPIECGIGSNT